MQPAKVNLGKMKSVLFSQHGSIMRMDELLNQNNLCSYTT